MRIERGPSLEDIRQSAENGTIVEFADGNGRQVRGRVVDSQLGAGIGRVKIALVEERTGLVWFSRYHYGALGRPAGEISPANLKRADIKGLTNGDLWDKVTAA